MTLRTPTTWWLWILVAMLCPQLTTAQHTGHDHRQCGFDPIMEKRMQEDPEFRQKIKNYKQNILPQLSAIPTTLNKSTPPMITIPVVVHVIHNGEPVGTGLNLSTAQILAQIDVLNEDFIAENPNFGDTPSQWSSAAGNPFIQFCMASTGPDGSPSTGITRHNIPVTGTNSSNTNIESVIKPQTNWDPSQYYNIYVLPIPGTSANGGVVGYAYLPFSGSVGNPNLDGTVVDSRWFGGPGFSQSGYKTLTHETGHYLGLFHTFNGNSCSDDDGITDTPNIDAPTSNYNPFISCGSGFPAGPSSCGNAHMYVNYMDYVNDDACATSFTQGQINVMRAVLDGTAGSFGFASRASLVEHSATACNFEPVENDAGISAIITPENQICGVDQITPIVTLTNYGDNTLNSVIINYQIDGGVPVSYNWTGNLLSGASVDISLSPFQLPSAPGGNFEFKSYTSNPNNVADDQPANDSTSLTVTPAVPFTLPLTEGFEGTAFNPTSNGVYSFNQDNDGFVWLRTTDASGYGNGTACAVFDNYEGTQATNPNGKVDALMTPLFDFSNIIGASLSLDLAYAMYVDDNGNLYADTLKIIASTDCGVVYDQTLFVQGGSTLETASPFNESWTPNSNQWRTEVIDLSALDGLSEVSLAIVNKSGWGNRLFIDNININTDITPPPSCNINANMQITPISCNGESDGLVSVNPTGGAAPYNFLWSTGSTNNSISGLSSGDYTVTITDAEDCEEIRVANMIEPAAIAIIATQIEEDLSVTNETGSAEVNAEGGTPPYDILWSNGTTTKIIENVPWGEYTVAVTDALGCIVTTTVTIGINTTNCSGFSVFISNGDVSCHGEYDGSATAEPIGGTSPFFFEWSNDQTTQTIDGLPAGNYSLTLTDSESCTTMANVTILEPTPLQVTTTGTNATSQNANDGTATVTATGGTGNYSYLWSTGENTMSISNLTPGNYSVIVTDENDCSQTATVTIEEAITCLSFSAAIAKTAVSCQGANDGTAIANPIGGASPYIYVWSNDETTQTINNLSIGDYAVTVEDSDGCRAYASTDIKEPDALILNPSWTNETVFNANDGTATISLNGGTPGYTYLWSNGATSPSINNLAPGIYSVEVTDQNNCTATASVTIEAGINPCENFNSSIMKTMVSCFSGNDATATANPTNGLEPYSYLWSNGQVARKAIELSAGIYTLTVSDANNCVVNKTIQIQEPNELETAISTEDIICGAPGSANINGVGGTPPYNFAWSNGQYGTAVNNLSAGEYQVTLSDSKSCEKTVSVPIELISPAIVFDLQEEDISCFEAADGAIDLTLSEGTAPFELQWNNGATTEDIESLPPGNYNVFISDAANCNTIGSVTISQPLALNLNVDINNATSGNNGSAIAVATGGTAPYQYNWSNGTSGVSVGELAPGTYSVSVIDGMGCVTEQSFEIETTTSVADLEENEFFKVFPNPANGQVTIEASLKNEEITNITIYNVLGQEIISHRVYDKSVHLQIDISRFVAGTYLVRLNTGKGQLVQRIQVVNTVN